MKNVYISELYKGLLVGLNELIDKTVKIQESTANNSYDYREALKFQIELEKTKLNIMHSLPDLFDTKIKSKELAGYDSFGREVFSIKENGDARFIGELTTDDAKNLINKETTVGVNLELINNKELNVLVDGKNVGKTDVDLETYVQKRKKEHMKMIDEEIKKEQKLHGKLMSNLKFTTDYWKKYYDDKLNEINIDASTGQVEILGDLTESNILSEDIINNELTDDTSVIDFIDKIFEEARQIIVKRLNEIDDQNKYHINITVNESNASASKFASEIMNKLEKYKGSLS